MIVTKHSNLSGWINTVQCGNSVELLGELPSNCVDMVVTDPPYGIEYASRFGKTKGIANDTEGEAKKLWGVVVPELYRVLKDNTASIFFADKMMTWSKDILAESFDVKGGIVWCKNVWGLGRYLRHQWEIAWYVHKGTPPMPVNQFSDVWFHSRDDCKYHSHQKPVSLMEQSIVQCGGGGLVLDPFCGSGATLVASKALGCRYIGFDLHEPYVDISRKRLADTGLSTKEERMIAGVPLTFENL